MYLHLTIHKLMLILLVDHGGINMVNYESILLELMQRVQELEKRVGQLEAKENGNHEGILSINNHFSYQQQFDSLSQKKISKMDQIRDYLEELFKNAKAAGKTELTLRAGDVEKAVGLTNRIVMVINAMHEFQEKYRNEVLATTNSGYSTTVVIKYYLD